MRIKALQLTWHSAFQSRSGSLWHQPGVPRRPSAACAKQLSVESVGGRFAARELAELWRGSCSSDVRLLRVYWSSF
jgi:hypothetical protein